LLVSSFRAYYLTVIWVVTVDVEKKWKKYVNFGWNQQTQVAVQCGCIIKGITISTSNRLFVNRTVSDSRTDSDILGVARW